jgi:hypothetical protein
MIDSEILKKLQGFSLEDRISVIEAILGSLKNDIKKDDSPGSFTTNRPQRPAFGFMKGTGKIVGDVVAPILPENTWEVLQ